MREEEITDEVFKSAVTIVQAMPKDGGISISNNEKLEFYALFKQATIGQCRGSRPAVWNLVERYKWDAWSSLGSLNPKEAQKTYVIKLKTVMDKVFEKHDVDELMQNESWSKIRELVRPHFEKIGRPLKSQSKEIAEAEIDSKTVSNPDIEQQKADGALSTDEEYADACDSPPVVVEANGIGCSSNVAPTDPEPNVLKTEVVSYVQSTTQVLLHQIQILSNTLQKQNTIIQKFIDFMKAKQSNPIGWPFLLLLFIWPVLVQLAIRYFFRQN